MSTDAMVQALAIPVENRTCNWYAEHDEDGEPCGPVCEEPASHIIEWFWINTGQYRWSFACPAHNGPPGIDPPGTHGWAYAATELPRKATP